VAIQGKRRMHRAARLDRRAAKWRLAMTRLRVIVFADWSRATNALVSSTNSKCYHY
jgi:hypothetical protein